MQTLHRYYRLDKVMLWSIPSCLQSVESWCQVSLWMVIKSLIGPEKVRSATQVGAWWHIHHPMTYTTALIFLHSIVTRGLRLSSVNSLAIQSCGNRIAESHLNSNESQHDQLTVLSKNSFDMNNCNSMSASIYASDYLILIHTYFLLVKISQWEAFDIPKSRLISWYVTWKTR